MRRDRPLRLAAACPKCFQAPAVRPFPALVAAARALDPNTEALSIQCQNCGFKYVVGVDAFDGAA